MWRLKWRNDGRKDSFKKYVTVEQKEVNGEKE